MLPSQSLALWAVLSALAFAYAALVYARREIAVRGRRWLALLRGAALSVVILILLNPALPGGVNRALPRILVDRSGSMATLDPAEVDAALAATRSRLGQDALVLEFGGASELAPLLVSAVESGAEEIAVVSDLRVSDPVAAEAVIRSARTEIQWVDVGRPVVNAGVGALEVESGALTGDPVRGVVTLAVEDGEGDTTVPVSLSLRLSGGSSLDTTVAATPGRATRVTFALNGPEVEGTQLLEAAVALDGDVFPADDGLQALVETGRGGGDVVLLSAAPDWEPRFLLPVLAEVTGLPARGFLAMGEAGFLRMGGGAGVASRAQVETALSQARLVVYQGDVPGWALGAPLPGTPRILLPAAPAEPGPGGEWYLSPEIPASPVAAELVGVSVLGLPPLSPPEGAPGRAAGARATPGQVPASPGGIPALELQLAGRGQAVPALYLDQGATGRWARATARGFWRWGFRDGDGREVYRRLWSGVAGWLLADGSDRPGGTAAGPAAPRLSPGQVAGWRFPQAAGGRAAIRFTRDTTLSASAGAAGAGETGAADTGAGGEVLVDSLGRAQVTSPQLPGIYRWTADFSRQADTVPPAEGRVLVGEPELDLLHPRAVSLLDAEPVLPTGEAQGSGRPLRTHPAPYLLLLAFLSTEWIGRRRSGLR